MGSKGSQPYDSCKGAAYEARRVADNLVRLRVVTKIFIGLTLWFFTLNIAALIFGNRSYSSSHVYPLLYGGVLLLNLIVAIVVQLAKQRPQLKPRDVRYYRYVNFAYIVIMLMLSATISLVDMPNFGHPMVFTMSLLICSSFLLTSNKEILAAVAFPSALLFVGLPSYVEAFDVLMELYQELAAYIPISIAISRVLYKGYCDNYRSSVRLEQEVATNRMLNRRLKEVNNRLEALASVDELTGIANRRGLHVHLDDLLAEKGVGFTFAAIMMDIDHFKDYNDYYGHSQGDEVLARVARVLRVVADQTSGFICRWGGEEFLYVAADKDRKGILEICKNISDRIGEMEISHPRSMISQYVSLSQGASSAKITNRDDIMATIQQADRALYKVKSAGRNSYIYKPFPEDGSQGEGLAVGH